MTKGIPCGISFFEKMITNGYYYVDKTMMIRQMNRFMDEGNKYICVSRPRRFGKTVDADMLVAYYSRGCDSRAQDTLAMTRWSAASSSPTRRFVASLPEQSRLVPAHN